MKVLLVVDSSRPDYQAQLAELCRFARSSGIDSACTEIWKSPGPRPETALTALESAWSESSAHLLLFDSSQFGKEVASRLAARIGGSSESGVAWCGFADGALLVDRAAYGNNATVRLRLSLAPYCISVAKEFEAPSRERTEVSATRRDLPEKTLFPMPHNDGVEDSEEDAITFFDDPLEAVGGSRPLAIVAGRGVGNATQVARLKAIAEALNADFFVTRPVVMNGWAPMSRLVGASGAVVSPRLCLTIGVSGSSALRYGIEKSETVISINVDTHAPISAHADLAIVGRWEPVIKELEKLLEQL